MRRPFSAANRRSRISARQGSLLPAGRVRRPRFPHLAFGPHPSRHGSESASSHPPPCQKDVRRGVRRRDRGQRPQLQKKKDTLAHPRHFPHDPDTKRLRDGQAATVAGHVGPGFHNWPSGHIPQATDTRPLPRIRSPTQKTFGETFGEARAATVASSFASKDRAAPGSATPATEEPWRTRHYPQATDTKRLRREVDELPDEGMGSRTRSALRQSDGNRRERGRDTDRPGSWGGSPAFIHRFFRISVFCF